MTGDVTGDVTGEVVVLGDLMTDVVTTVHDPLTLGSDTAARICTRQGGAGGNVAAWLAALGRPVRLVGRVGDDPFGREALAVLRDSGVRLDVGVDPTAPTGACVVLVGDDGERTMLPDAGANSTLAPADLPVPRLREACHVHVSGYTLLNPGSRDAGREALAQAAAAGVPTSVDVASAAPLEAVGAAVFTRLTERVELVFCTLDEAEVLCGSRDPATVVARLTAHHPQVVLKLGEQGAWWSGGEGPPVRGPAADVSQALVDTTGAGDAFAAAYLAAVVVGAPVQEALARACRLGALLVTREGTRPTGADLAQPHAADA